VISVENAGGGARVPTLRVEIVKRSDDRKGFVVPPRRWVVERTFSWFGRNPRPAKDFENLAETLANFVILASIQLPSDALLGRSRELSKHPLPTGEAGCGFGERTLAGARGNDGVAPSSSRWAVSRSTGQIDPKRSSRTAASCQFWTPHSQPTSPAEDSAC
jgi:hypothetical protein